MELDNDEFSTALEKHNTASTGDVE
ncbi:MAG: hypothetical protein J07AB43_08770 [Candidatus Nanosalina sp. J07AB43]|nr:MAG: hypothetical protein J07AB43_08770 [Candidatus Nanosalina sp. J07AB43]